MQADAFAWPTEPGSFDAAFAGLWLLHAPIERRREFLVGLHAPLAPGARVALIDNSDVQCARLPIVEQDACGNTYQLRALPDGSTHRVLKIFPSELELRSTIEAIGNHAQYWRGAHFRAFWYDAV